MGFGGVYAGPEDEVANSVSKIVRNIITRLHAEVNRSINFYRSQQKGTPPSLILLTGGSSIIAHIDTFFREKLRVQVEYLNPCMKVAINEGIDADRISGDLHLLGETVGLALRHALACPVEINLMPPELVAKKIFRKRQPFFALAAAGLLLIMLCWWGYSQRMKSVAQERIKSVEMNINDLHAINSRLQRVKDKKKEAWEKTANVVDIIDQRTKWIGILRTIHSCMLDGMWLTSLAPVIAEDGVITHIEIGGMGFLDKLKDKSDLTAIEEFRNKLRESKYFTEETKITKELRVEEIMKEFEISAALGRKPSPHDPSGEGGSL